MSFSVPNPAYRYCGKHGRWWWKRHMYELCETTVFHSKSGHMFVLEQGLKSDMFSLPFPLSMLFWFRRNQAGLNPGSFLHDDLYAKQGKVNHRTYSRKRADELLKEAMESLGASWLKSWVFYIGVRIGGWAAWRSKR